MTMLFSRPFRLSLAPGFSPVLRDMDTLSRFNGFHMRGKLLKQFDVALLPDTGLKPGANEIPELAMPPTIHTRFVNRKS